MIRKRWLALIPVAVSAGLSCKDSSGPPPRIATTINVNRSAVGLDAIGATDQLAATVFDQNGDTLKTQVTWTSNATGVATVNATGVVTAVGNGTAQITATAGDANRAVAVTVAQMARALDPIDGDGQSGTVAAALPIPLEVQANDRLGAPVGGVLVAFQVTQGNGSVAATPVTTDAGGRATTTWTLGTTAGTTHRVVASLPGGVATAVFGATATPGAPSALAKIAGDGQSRSPGSALPDSLVAAVVDQYGNPVAGQTIAFAVTSGGGAVSPAMATSGSNGRAATEWTLGPDLGQQTVEATSGAQSPVVFTADAEPYTIVIRYFGSSAPSASQQAAFDAAAARWEQLIVGDLQDVTVNRPADECVDGVPAISETVDDILIFAQVDSIDGPGSVVGQAGPCLIRGLGLPNPRLPIYGVMLFDEADLATIEANNLLQAVITHEMGHVLGFGSLWAFFGLLQDPSDPNFGGTAGADTHFDGARGLVVFDSLGGTGYPNAKVPVENDNGQFGSGSLDSHWRESVFRPTSASGNELMTPALNAGFNPLSAVTVASLEDMGYEVALGAADTYSFSFTALAAAGAVQAGSTWSLRLENCVLPLSVVEVDAGAAMIPRRR